MGDAGEGLVDASSRLAERMDEVEEARRLARAPAPAIDPERARMLESLRLMMRDIQRQLAASSHPARRAQLQAALADIERRFSQVSSQASPARV
jgi:hypothetical protein